MTCIIGMIRGKTVWMGGDSAVNEGSDFYIMTDAKVFVRGPYLIGYAGDLRMGQVMHYDWKYPTPSPRVNILKFMCGTFATSVKNLFLRHRETPESKDLPDLDILVGFRGRLFLMGSDFSVVEQSRPFVTIGSGGDVALGSLLTHEDPKPSPKQQIQKALEVTTSVTPYVRPPWTILSHR